MQSKDSLEDRVRRLHDTIAHFERLLEAGASTELAETYRAEIVAAKAMLSELERRRPRPI
jgi:hypothetical protein